MSVPHREGGVIRGLERWCMLITFNKRNMPNKLCMSYFIRTFVLLVIHIGGIETGSGGFPSQRVDSNLP
jgi:hypothetical protein